MTPAHISAVLQFITLTGAGIWVICFFWPALRKQLAFMVISLAKMEASEERMGEMVATMKAVAADIEKVAAVKEDVNWELTRKKVDKVYALAEYWINEATNYFTAERKMRGLHGLSRIVTGLGRLEGMVNSKG